MDQRYGFTLSRVKETAFEGAKLKGSLQITHAR